MADPRQVMGFHYVVEGELDLRIDGGESVKVAAGEAVMLPGNHAHVFSNGAGLAPIKASDLVPQSVASGLAKFVHGGGGDRTHVVCGFLGGNEQLHPLLSSLPPVMKIELAPLPSGDWIANTFAFAARMAADGDPGSSTVVAMVSELLFVEAVRRYLANLPPEETGWLAGLRDPAIGRALALLHASAGKEWTAEELAHEVHMSRSAFADRFTALIGQPPMRYLAAWRMQLARRQLLEPGQTIAQIAHDVGYDSEAAFTRAFRRAYGQPPAAWRKQQAAL
jgi:AraC-like DNA-binding protein